MSRTKQSIGPRYPAPASETNTPASLSPLISAAPVAACVFQVNFELNLKAWQLLTQRPNICQDSLEGHDTYSWCRCSVHAFGTAQCSSACLSQGDADQLVLIEGVALGVDEAVLAQGT